MSRTRKEDAGGPIAAQVKEVVTAIIYIVNVRQGGGEPCWGGRHAYSESSIFNYTKGLFISRCHYRKIRCFRLSICSGWKEQFAPL